MEEFSIQKNKQAEGYIKTQKAVYNEKSGKPLFQNGAEITLLKGLSVEKSAEAVKKSSSRQTANYKVDANSARQGKILADKLYEQIEGASLNSNTIKLLKQITPENVIFLLDAYNKKTKGKESLAQAINNEWGFDEVTVKEYLCPALVKLAKNKNIKGIYFGDYMKQPDIESLNEWITNAATNIKSSLGVNLAETTVLKKNPPPARELEYSDSELIDIAKIYLNQQNKVSGQDLGGKLFEKIRGISNPLTTRNYLKEIDSRNVIEVMKEYEKQSKGSETLIDAVADEYGLTKKDCKKLGVKLAKYARNNKINIDDYVKEFNSADDINSIKTVTKKIYDRIISSGKNNKEVSLAKYTKWFANDNQILTVKFEMLTGVSLENAILQDPTISRAKKLDLIRNSFSNIAKEASGKDISDIIKNANDDLQALSSDNDFKKYSALYETTIQKINYRIYSENQLSVDTNAKIDKDFKQGYVGDCWLLAAIKGISLKPKGLKILNESLKLNSDGSISVHLKGVDRTYRISKKELLGAIEFSAGDGDIRAIEIAVNRYLREEYKNNDGESASSDGNFEMRAYEILTGKGGHFFPLDSEVDEFFNPEWYGKEPISDELIDTFNDEDQVTCVSSHGEKKIIEVNTLSNGKGILTTGHAYTVTHADDKNVYIVNPWDSSAELIVDKKTFKKFFDKVDRFNL